MVRTVMESCFVILSFSIIFDQKALCFRHPFIRILHESDAGDEWLDDVNLLRRGEDEQLID